MDDSGFLGGEGDDKNLLSSKVLRKLNLPLVARVWQLQTFV